MSNRRLHVYASMQKLLDIECEMSLGFSFVMKIRLLLLRYFVYLFFIQAIWLPMTGIPCYGQGLAHIVGTVTDKDGAVVPSAHVVATAAGTGTATEVVVNDNGNFVFPALPPAVYDISVTGAGFAKFVEKGIQLQADQTQTVNVVLGVGAATQSVEVSAISPQVDTTTGTLSQVIGERQVNELPLNGRNAAVLTTLVAGVVLAPNGAADQGNTKSFPVVVTISANGTRANQTSYLLDGGNNVDEYTNVNAPFPFPDALQEFSVQTSNYSAEYGQNAGAVVNVITKSGTSQYHGDVFEYVRNRIFNARNYFQNTVDPLKRNQFGGAVGGPLGLPGLWQAKKAFFFFGVQKTIARTQNAPSSTTVPTTANLNGRIPILAGAKGITNPFTGAFYPADPNGIASVDPSTFDPSSMALLKHLPVVDSTNTAPVTLNFLRPLAQDFLEYVARYDQNVSTKDRFAVRYYYNEFANAGVLNLQNLTTYADGSNIDYQNALISETHTFSDSLLNNFIISYQREFSTRGPLDGGINANDIGIPIWQPSFKSIQSIGVANYFTMGDNPFATFLRSNITLADDLHWVKGQHNIAIGFHGEISKVDVVNQNGQPGTFSFAASNGNTSLANFLFGYLATFSQNSGQFQQNRAKYYGGYVQDSWRLGRRLVLNYGLRYEPYIPLHEKGNRMGQFNPEAYAQGRRSTLYPNAPAGLLFAGDSGVPVDGIRPVYTNFMPRVGVAYDVFGTGRTSIRGGGGMFYDTRSNGLFNNAWIGSAPFVTSVNLSPANTRFSNPYGATTNPFPTPFPPPASAPFIGTPSVITFDPSGTFKVPLTYAWNLALEQQMTERLSTRIAYVGGHGSHIFTSPDINPAIYGPGATTANTNSRRRYPGYASIAMTDMGGSSSYQSLQATLQERATRGLSFSLNYTWSKSLDNVPNGAAVTSAGAGQSFSIPVTMTNYKRLDVGPSDFDHRNVLTGTYVWEFPKLSSGWTAIRAVVNGWQSSGLISARTGDRFTVFVGQDVSLTGLNRDVPNLIGNPYNVSSCATSANRCKSWLAFPAFSNPTQGSFGTVQKNTFVGPNFVTFDTSLTRRFQFGEAANLQFRAEYFNVLNHTNFMTPAGTLSNSATFGKITTANDPRIAQLSLKLSF